MKTSQESRITVEALSPAELESRGVLSWPIWEKEVSRFDWTYDSQEQCYFLAGRVTVETDRGSVSFGEGDFVTFEKGLSCVWDVSEAVRKHYRFA
ncbi:MAG: cupin domain-containing protein [Candidatus Omnitrophica bacterium]|nr:cupin domain-containing protein [Candidatus Omnitrophota bacterium]